MEGSETLNCAKGAHFDWRRPLSSAYFRSAGSYLGLKLAIYTAAGLATQLFLTHFLAREDYGLLVWTGSIVALLGIFGLPGISVSITGAVARGFHGNFRRGTWLEIAGGTLGGVALLCIAAYYRFSAHEELKSLMFLTAAVLGPGLWLDTHLKYWNGIRDFRAIFWWSVPVRLLQLLVTVGVLYFTSSPVWVFALQTGIVVFANLGAAFFIMGSESTNHAISKEYMGFGWFSNLLNLFGTISSQIDKLAIGALWGLDKLAVFFVGELIYRYFFMVPKGALDQIFMPRLAGMDLKDAAAWIRRRQPFVMVSLVALLVPVALVLPTVYRVIFSGAYVDSVFYAYLFLLNIVAGSPVLLVGAMIKAHGLKKESAAAQAIISLTPLALIFPFGYLWGIKGFVFARIGQNLALSLYCNHVLRKASR